MVDLIHIPQSLMPHIRRNTVTGGVSIEWPDVCYCPVNGGVNHDLHHIGEACQVGDESEQWACTCPESGHVKGCAFDSCPIAQCHPMCSQVTGDDQDNWCHCPCHG